MSSSTGVQRAPVPASPDSPVDAQQPDAFLAAEGLTLDNDQAAAALPVEAPPPNGAALADTYREIMIMTRRCVLYGTGGFAIMCILVGSLEALFGR